VWCNMMWYVMWCALWCSDVMCFVMWCGVVCDVCDVVCGVMWRGMLCGVMWYVMWRVLYVMCDVIWYGIWCDVMWREKKQKASDEQAVDQSVCAVGLHCLYGYCGLVRGPHVVKITVSGTPNGLNYVWFW